MLGSERCGRVRLKSPNRVDGHMTMVELELVLEAGVGDVALF
jgi:hypothetical protein